MRTQSQAEMIRSLLRKRMAADAIVKRVKKARGGKPTVAYVNWIKAHAPRVSTKRTRH